MPAIVSKRLELRWGSGRRLISQTVVIGTELLKWHLAWWEFYTVSKRPRHTPLACNSSEAHQVRSVLVRGVDSWYAPVAWTGVPGSPNDIVTLDCMGGVRRLACCLLHRKHFTRERCIRRKSTQVTTRCTCIHANLTVSRRRKPD